MTPMSTAYTIKLTQGSGNTCTPSTSGPPRNINAPPLVRSSEPMQGVGHDQR